MWAVTSSIFLMFCNAYVDQTVIHRKLPNYKLTPHIEYFPVTSDCTLWWSLRGPMWDNSLSCKQSWTKQTLFANTRFSFMCNGWYLQKAKEKQVRERSGRMERIDRWRDDGERKKEKSVEEERDTGRRHRVEGVGEHVLLSVCLLIPLDFFCLPFPRSQC